MALRPRSTGMSRCSAGKKSANTTRLEADMYIGIGTLIIIIILLIIIF